MVFVVVFIIIGNVIVKRIVFVAVVAIVVFIIINIVVLVLVFVLVIVTVTVIVIIIIIIVVVIVVIIIIIIVPILFVIIIILLSISHINTTANHLKLLLPIIFNYILSMTQTDWPELVPTSQRPPSYNVFYIII